MTTLIQSETNTTSTGIKPEIELLLYCAHTHIDETVDDNLSLRIKNLVKMIIDWEYLLQKARYHKVIPLLYSNLQNICPEAVPEHILKRLQKSCYLNTIRNINLTKELLKLLQLFEIYSIRAIPFKGPILSMSLYGNLSCRQIGDLDILVYQKDFNKTREILISQGYKSHNHFGWQESFFHPEKKVYVDVHKRVTQKYFPCQLNFEDLWQRLEFINIFGKKVANFSSEDLLIILCAQITRDCFEKTQSIFKICDIAQLITVKPDLDWQKVLQLAKSLGSERLLFFGLNLANNFLETPLPQEVYNQIQKDLVIKLYTPEVYQRMFFDIDQLHRFLGMSLRKFMLIKSPPGQISSQKHLIYYYFYLLLYSLYLLFNNLNAPHRKKKSKINNNIHTAQNLSMGL